MQKLLETRRREDIDALLNSGRNINYRAIDLNFRDKFLENNLLDQVTVLDCKMKRYTEVLTDIMERQKDPEKAIKLVEELQGDVLYSELKGLIKVSTSLSPVKKAFYLSLVQEGKEIFEDIFSEEVKEEDKHYCLAILRHLRLKKGRFLISHKIAGDNFTRTGVNLKEENEKGCKLTNLASNCAKCRETFFIDDECLVCKNCLTILHKNCAKEDICSYC